ncbi:MAG: hypothetical protein FWF81_14600 [Defluviitaleaceae bacterium]|nr:hypothetical protein [Defluviitaleaceae bacterium]
MDISSVSQLVSGVNSNQQSQAPPPIPGMSPSPTSAGVEAGTTDTYVPGQQPAEPQSFAIDRERVSSLWNQHQERVDSFRRMVETLLGQQAERQGLVDGWNISDIEITPEMRTEADELLSEGGYFSVEETAARMLDFAVALTGGDPARIEVMRDAVQRGFNQAERMFGGELPEISHQTLEAVMNGFDEWAEAGSASAITLLNR